MAKSSNGIICSNNPLRFTDPDGLMAKNTVQWMSDHPIPGPDDLLSSGLHYLSDSLGQQTTTNWGDQLGATILKTTVDVGAGIVDSPEALANQTYEWSRDITNWNKLPILGTNAVAMAKTTSDFINNPNWTTGSQMVGAYSSAVLLTIGGTQLLKGPIGNIGSKNKAIGLVKNEYQNLISSGMSHREIGPAISIARDMKAGKFSQIYRNDSLGNMPSNLSDPIAIRLYSAPEYIKTKGIASHSEIYAVDELLKARPKAALEDISVFTMEVKKASLRGTYKPACPHCAHLLEGVDYIK